MFFPRASRAASATILAGLLGIALASPAASATARFTDPADTGHGSDLRAVRVTHGARFVIVTTRHSNLRRDPSTGSAGAVYLDTDPTDRGPEFVFVGGYFEGTDYQLIRTDGFGRKRWISPVEGRYSMRLDYAEDKVRMRMPRPTLGRPTAVRVAVEASGLRSDGTARGLRDWLGEPRSFTPWVARG